MLTELQQILISYSSCYSAKLGVETFPSSQVRVELAFSLVGGLKLRVTIPSNSSRNFFPFAVFFHAVTVAPLFAL